jgi:sulfite dehydrogenase
MMTGNAVRAFGLALAGAVLAAMAPAAAQRTITLPPETAAYLKSELPGYQLVLRNCIGCHSAHYVQMQPPTLARVYWENTVKRMKKPFGAQFPDEDVATMADYLVKTYGNERAAK